MMKFEYPLAEVSLTQVSELLGLSITQFDKPIEESDFTTFLQSQPEIATVSLKKIRNIYDIQGLKAEFTQIHLNTRKIFTIALESEDPEKISDVKHLMGFDNLENENYPDVLKRMSGYKGA